MKIAGGLLMLKPYYQKDITIFAETNFRDQRKNFGIKRPDRRKHMYIVGKTGMGKTSLLEHMIVQDMKDGEGLCLIDSSGTLIEQILHFVPESRVRDVIYFNPADIKYPVAFNLLEESSREPQKQQELVLGLVNIFKDLWSDIWSPRLEYVWQNVLLTLISKEGYTLLHALPLFADENFRQCLIDHLKDPGLINFWRSEYQSDPERFIYQAVKPIQDKVGQMISNLLLRNIIGQSQTSFSFREILEQKKIVLITLNKNEIGQDIASLLGSCFIIKLLQEAKYLDSRFRQENSRDLFLYIDECHHFASLPLAELVSTSDYGINLVLANQYLDQLPDSLVKAVLGNVGTILAFRLGVSAANILVEEFQPEITVEDFIKLAKHNIILRLCIDGEISKPFTATTLEPLPVMGLVPKIIAYSRETYGYPQEEVERRIVKSLQIKTEPVRPRAKKEAKAKTKKKKKKIVPPVVTTSLESVAAPTKIEAFRRKISQITSQLSRGVTKEGILPAKLKPKRPKDTREYRELKPGEEAKF